MKYYQFLSCEESKYPPNYKSDYPTCFDYFDEVQTNFGSKEFSDVIMIWCVSFSELKRLLLVLYLRRV